MRNRSRNISKLTGVVDDIAFRANILALHAFIAMAGAGEDGLEYAVVADEVRDLAHRGAQAAQTSPLVEQEPTL